jgi:hypothetical protein
MAMQRQSSFRDPRLTKELTFGQKSAEVTAALSKQTAVFTSPVLKGLKKGNHTPKSPKSPQNKHETRNSMWSQDEQGYDGQVPIKSMYKNQRISIKQNGKHRAKT